jgi:hypothetical protein
MYQKRINNWILNITCSIEKFLMDSVDIIPSKNINHEPILKKLNLIDLDPKKYIQNLYEDDDLDSFNFIYIFEETTLNSLLNDIGHEYFKNNIYFGGFDQETVAESENNYFRYIHIFTSLMKKYLVQEMEYLIDKRLYINDFILESINIINDVEYFNIFCNKITIFNNIRNSIKYNDFRSHKFYPNLIIKFYEGDKEIFDKVTLLRCGFRDSEVVPMEVIDVILLFYLLI